ncbi:MAG: iron-containing alcohol dehydrogenase, partial [Planctomycetaceae bacterium]|nr:iron-containing alcohol dehydrogenase [Planctomycetaceae bacterium]
MNYSLLLPCEIHVGWGERARLPRLVAERTQRVFLITGGRSLAECGVRDAIITTLQGEDIEVIGCCSTGAEPTVEEVDAVSAALIEQHATAQDAILAIGGGSVLDLAKAVSAMVTNAQGRSVREFLEGVGTGAELTHSPVPVIAVPTTAGTGTEVTKNAVISVADPACKKSLRAQSMLPVAVVVDPELTVSCPPSVTAASGMDAITQLIESFLSRRATAFTRMLCLEGLPGTVSALRSAFVDGDNRHAREVMSHAALLSGMALANSGLGFAHGVAAALGAISHVPHGLACAVLLPMALHVNRAACHDQFSLLAYALVPERS